MNVNWLKLSSSLRAKKAQVLSIIWSLLIVVTIAALPAHAQDVEVDTVEATAGNDVPLVYIDCGRCDYDHIRREITFVNYVRDPEQADIHVLGTNENTGGGGREYEFSFIGQGDFSKYDYTLMHTVDRNETWDEERDGVNEALKRGLMPYMMQTSHASRFSVTYEELDEEQAAQQEINDPWNYWVFNIYAGRLQTGIESNQSYFDSRWGFYADRVTEDWNIQVRPYFNFDHVVIDRGEDEEPITSSIHRHGVNSHAIMSLSDHWSAGFFGDYITRNDRNLNHRFRIRPGVEYSVLPYDVATRRSVTVVYSIGYAWVDYYETTIFDKRAEELFNQQLEASVHVRQPWGSIRAGLTGSHYFHDFDHRRAEFFGDISVRLMDGLSLNFSADFEMIQDQLSLPLGDASLEEILLEQRELATDFELSGSVSLSYTFGSQFANVVNTRM